MKSIKVKQTEPYNQAIFCKGKLVLIWTNDNPTKQGQLIGVIQDCDYPYARKKGELAICEFVNADINVGKWKIVKPIIISETEKITENTKTVNEGLNGDFYYNTIYKSIAQTGDITDYDFKILALPENFSPKQLQDIVNDKLKDGDEVYLQVEHTSKMKDELEGNWHGEDEVYLNNNNHITLFPVKKEESWDDIFNKAKKYFKEEHPIAKVIGYNHEQFERWLKENYNTPTKK